METIKIPSHVDEPPYLLLWPADEFSVVAMIVLMGVAADFALFGIVCGFGLGLVYRRFKAGHADGYLLHVVYWLGVAPLKSAAFANSFARRWVP